MLKHMAWANQEVLGLVQTLPDEALACFVIDSEWTVGKILQHIVGAAGSYVRRLSGNVGDHIPVITTTDEVELYLKAIADFDSKILQQALLPDDLLEVKFGENSFKVARSTLIWQSVHHATEHRAQLVSALEVGGFKTISLDDFDLWSFGEKFN
jgi:uncharacterized damage-inducible protein DinB